MSRKAEFLSTIKPILDKKEAKQDAIELARELSDVLGEIDIGADGSGFNELKEIFNAQLVEMGKQPIVFSESTLKGITAQFANAVSEGIKAGVADGSVSIESGLMDQLDALKKKKITLQAKAEKITAKYEKFEHYSEMTSLDMDEDIKPLKFDGDDIDEQALSLMGNFIAAQDALSSLKKGTKEYEQALIDAVEAGEKLFQMRLTLEKNKSSVRDTSILEDYKLINLNDTTSDVFDAAEGYFTKKLRTWDFRGEGKKIGAEIEKIDKQIDDLQKNNADIFQQEQAKKALKTLEEVEDAYNRISTKKGEIKKTPAKNLHIALGEEQETRTLTQLRNDYNKIKDTGNWEDVYTSIARFVNKFESELQAGKISQDRLPEYTKLYDQFTPIINSVRTTLDSLANYAKGIVSQPAVSGGGDNVIQKQAADAAEKGMHAAQETTESEKERLKVLQDITREYDEQIRLNLQQGERKETAGHIDSKTGKTDRFVVGGQYGVAIPGGVVEDYSFFGGKKPHSDIGVHSHWTNAAAPSPFVDGATEEGDLHRFKKRLNYQSLEIIRAMEEWLYLDFSKIKDTALNNLMEEYDKVGAQIHQYFLDMPMSERLRKFGSKDVSEPEQVALREEFARLASPYEGFATWVKEPVWSDPTHHIGNVESIDVKNKVAQDATKNIEKTIDLLNKEKLTYEDILTLVRAYNDEAQMKAAADAGDWDTYDKIFAHHTDIARKLVPTNMMGIGSDSPDSWLAMVGMSAEDAAQKLKDLYDRTHAIASIDDDEDDDIRRENGALEEKLELLRDIAEQYGNNITQKKRDRHEELNQKDMDSGLTPKEDERYWELSEEISEADEALLAFEETYERITIKLANGKKVEILPDDKGLRSLYEFADGYGDEFKGVEIEDVVFERAKKEAAAIEDVKQAQDGLNDSLREKQQLNAEMAQESIGGGASTAEVDNLRQQLDEANQRAMDADERAKREHIEKEIAEEALSNTYGNLWEEEQRAKDAEEEVARLQQELAERQHVPDGTLDGDGAGTEASQMTALKEAVEAVTTAVGLKTKAFQDEQTAVDQVVTDEIESLGRLEEKIKDIKSIFESLVNNIRNGSDDIGAGLSNVNINVNYPESSQTTLDQDALNKLAEIIKGTHTKTPETAIDVTGKALATENTLLAIKNAVESINSKTVKGTKVGSGSGRKSTTKSDYQGSPFFGEKLKTREMELAKFAQQLMNDGQDTAKMQDAVKHLRDALKLVNSGEKLSVWDQKFRQAKLAVGIDELKEKPDEQESVQTYKNLIAYAKEYYSIVEKYEKAKDNTRRKAILLQQKQDADAFMRDGGLNLDTLEFGDDVYNKKLSDLRAKHKRNLEVIRADKSDTTNSQQIKKESDALETLLGLYKEYGKLDAKWNYSDGKNAAAEQERQMLDVYKKIQEQKASIGITDDDAKYDDQITKAWEQGFKEIENAKREARAKASDRDETKRIQDEVKSVEKYVKELGALEAELQFASGAKEINEINRQMEQKKRYIDLKKQELQLDEKSLLIQQTKSYQNKYNTLSLKTRKAQDKSDDAAITKRNNEAYERLIKLRREQYDIEKKLYAVEKGSKLEATYKSQLTDIGHLIASQKTLVHYNAKYEQQLTEMANAHKRNKAQWESGKIDNARAEALAAEEKEVNKLVDAYRTLGKLIAERNYATLPEEKDAIQAIINKHVKDINANQYNTADRLDMLRGVARAEQTKSEEGLSRKAAKKTGVDRLRTEAKVENEELAKQKQIISNLISLYKQLGQAKARQNTSLFSDEQVAQAHVEDAQIRRLIKAERAKLSSVDLDTDMRFKSAKAEGHRLATTNAERAAAGKATSQRMREKTKAKNDALKEQKQIVTDLVALYKQLGQAEAKRDMMSQNGAEERMADKEVQSINDQIEAKRKLIKVNNELENQFADSWMSGIESETKKPIRDLGKEYEKLGKLRAEVDRTPDNDYLVVLKKQLATQQKLVDTESRRLDISNDLRDSYNQKADSAYNDKIGELEEKAAKERDKARKQAQADLVRQRDREFKEEIKRSQKDAKLTQAESLYGKGIDTLSSANLIDGLTDEQISKLNQYKDALSKLKQQIADARALDGPVSDGQKEKILAQTKSVNELTKEINELIVEYNRLSGDNATEIKAFEFGDTASIEEYRKQLTEAVMAHTNGKAHITGFDAATKELNYTLDTGKYEVTEFTAAARHMDGQIVSLQGNTKRLETPLEKLKRKMSEIMTYFGGSSLIYEVFGQVRQGIQYVREIDGALTELKKVTDETEESYDRFLDTAAKTADKVGSTITNIVSSTADWARLGFSMEEAAQLAESTSVLLNVSEFSSIEDATSALTSTMQAFGYVAEDSMHVVDVLNEVGNNFAISSDGIATALQDSASALMAANNSYEEAVALIAAANRVVQDPNSVGAALRTISLRLRGTSVEELESAGEDTTGAITSKSKLRGKIKTLSGVDILTDTGAYKSTYEILLEISRVWKKMSDIDQAALLEILAGKNRANTAMAILSNTTDLEEAYVQALEAEGSAYAENEKYLDSIQGKIDLFTNAVQTMWSNTIQDEWVKGFVELGTEIIKFVDKLKLIPSILIAIGSYKGISGLFKHFKDSGVTIKSVLTYLNSLTVGFKKNAIAQTAANAATLKQDAANKLVHSSIVQRLAAEQLDGKLKEANMMREVRLVALKQALALAEEQYADGLIDDAALQAAKNAVDAASVPITLSQFSATTLLSAAFKGLAISIWEAIKAIGAFLFTNPVGWMILLVSAVAGGVALFNKFHKTTEKLTEELDNLKSELQDIQSELDSLNSELETTQSRMAELLALDTLSFTEKEELENLQKQNDELEREIYLLERRQKRKQKQTEETFNELMDGEFNNGTVQMGVSTNITEKMQLDLAMSSYKSAMEQVEKANEDLVAAEQSLEAAEQNGDKNAIKKAKKEVKKAEKEVKKAEKTAKSYQDHIDSKLTQYTDAADGIDYDAADTQTKEYLDYIYNLEDAFNIITGGEKAKSVAITRIFNKEEFSEASETIDALVEKLKQNPGDSTIINRIRQQCQLAEDDLRAVGLSVDDAVDSFTMFESESSFDTVKKKLDELGGASQKFSDLLNGKTFKVDDINTGLVDLFDEEGKIIQTKLSQIFNNTDEQTRKDITNVLESAYDAIKDGLDDNELDQLITKVGFKFSRQIMEAQKQGLVNENIELFPGLEEEISGIIDTFDELVKSVGSVVDALDALDQARAEEAYSGSVSLETLSKLMASTENYADLIEVDETGAIKLATNAQEILVQQKIDAIKKNAELALADAELALQEAIHAEQTYTQTGPAQEFLRGMTMEVGGAVAFVSSLWNDLINGNWSGAWDRAVGARDTALASSKSSYAAKAAEASANVEAAAKQVENAKKMNDIAQGLTPDNIKTRYSSDEASGGTKNADDAADKKTEDALEALQKKYERHINNLDNQQTYLQNEIDLLEAKNEAVSKSYYEKQIDLEEQKLNLYKQERDALLQLDMTDEVANALWEVEHAIQESTLSTVEFRKSIIDLYDEAFSDVAEAYDNKDDLLEDRQNYIDKYQQLMELQGNPASASGYNELIDAEQEQLDNNIAKLEALIAVRDAAYANSDIEELSDEQWIAMDDDIRAVEEAILDNKIALEEYNQELKNLYVDAFSAARDAFSFKDEFYTNQQDYIEGYADYLEAIGVDAPKELYDALIEIEQKKRENAVTDLVDARAGLADLEAQGFTAADEEWQDAYSQIVALEKKIQDSDIATAQWEKTIRDMDLEKFERFISRLDDINSEIEHIQNLLSDEDVAFDDGTWTKEGITSLGLLYQQMKLAQQKSKEYAEEIDELNATYAEGAMSEQEYYECLQELKESQWDAVELYEDAKDAIVDMEEARIDMIEDGINEEIEAYQELINLKREELDAERDLYEFKKNIQSQTKDIATLERRIAAMSGSTDAATVAERTKLEAELREAQEGLDDTYYTHAKDMQNQALDDETTSYQEAKENYLKTLRDALDDTAAIIEAKISEFLLNADVGLEELNGISQEHGITLSDYLMRPWQSASEISSAFKLTADENLWSLINEDGVVTIFSSEAKVMLEDVFSSAGDAAQLFNSNVTTVVDHIKNIVEQSTSPLTGNLSFPWEDAANDGGPISNFSTTAEGAIQGVIDKAQGDFQKLSSYLSSPFAAAEDAAETFNENTVNRLDAVIKKAKEVAEAIALENSPAVPSYTGSDSDGDDGDGDSGAKYKYYPNKNLKFNQLANQHSDTPSEEDVRALQTCLNMLFSSGLTVDGKLGSSTKSALKKAQKTMYLAGNETMKSQDGLYGTATRAAMVGYINKKISSLREQGGSSMIGQAIQRYNTVKNMLPKAFYAKGTLGTDKDEWALTDEIGDELVLIPGKDGNLQYMRKGTAVIPADISANLMEWGKLNPNMDMSGAIQGINLMTNVVNKPELNLEFDSLVHIDNCSNEVIPEVKKIITEQLENFTKKLNYNLKRVGSMA